MIKKLRRSLLLMLTQLTLISSLIGILSPSPAMARVENTLSSHSAVFNDLPRVALLMKEQYVEPERIDTAAMLAAILESLESYISRLVVSLPKSLDQALEKSKKGEEYALLEAQKNALSAPASTSSSAAPMGPAPLVKEKIEINLGGVKKVFDYEAQKSIWGMTFLLRDIYKFVEEEAKRQGLDNKLKNQEPLDWKKIGTGAINAMLGTLDPHSVYLPGEQARDLTLTTKGEFGGVGIVISVRDGYLTVISPIDGTPAAKKGVQAKDRIVRIDEDSAINMPLEDAVTKLRGAPKSSVKIAVLRGNSTKEIEFVLEREVIKVDSVAYALLDNDIGYLRIKAFQGNTDTDVKNAILKMKADSKNKMTGLILDLRDNPGGLLTQAIRISDFFISSGELVSTQDARKSRQVEEATPGELDKDLKIACLINGGSASASEIVAGALKYGAVDKDNPLGGRAILIGDSATFGKGSVQMLFDLPNLQEKKDNKESEGPAALKLTIAQYYGPQEKGIQTIGIEPDIKLLEVKAQKAEELSLFQNTSMREIDLEAHLSVSKKREENNLYQMSFLSPKTLEEGLEYGKLEPAKLKKEFAIIVATEFLRTAKGVKRSDLLAEAVGIKERLEKEEQRKIAEALKKFNIDWSQGEKLKNGDALKTSIVANPGAKAGDKLKVVVKVKNTSAIPAYQVHAITHSKTPLFDQREFLFGKIDPAQEVERAVEFEIPKDVITRKDLMTLELRDVAKDKLSELNVPLEITGLGRPRFAHAIIIDDAKAGNSDGKVQNDEEVELVVWLKNIGDGKATEPTVILRNNSGSKVFLKTGRVQLAELAPNKEGSARFSFRVKEPSELVDFELQIFDGQMHDIWRDKLSLDISKKEKVVAKKTSLSVSSKVASLYAKADASSSLVASLKEGLRCESLGELKDFYLVRADENLVGFVKKSDMKTHVKQPQQSPQKKAELYTINYQRIPPKVDLKFSDGSGWTKNANGNVVAKLSEIKDGSELLIYVNLKKVLYKSIATSTGETTVQHQVSLKPGVNIISVIAREDAIFGQRENITVFYDDQNRALALPEKVNTSQASAPRPNHP